MGEPQKCKPPRSVVGDTQGRRGTNRCDITSKLTEKRTRKHPEMKQNAASTHKTVMHKESYTPKARGKQCRNQFLRQARMSEIKFWPHLAPFWLDIGHFRHAFGSISFVLGFLSDSQVACFLALVPHLIFLAWRNTRSFFFLLSLQHGASAPLDPPPPLEGHSVLKWSLESCKFIKPCLAAVTAAPCVWQVLC